MYLTGIVNLMNLPSRDGQIAAALRLALNRHQEGRLAEALGMYEQVLGNDPNNLEAMQGSGVLNGQLGRFEEAQHYLQSACNSRPKDFFSHYNAGVALQELGRYEEALLSYEWSLKLRPVLVEGYIFRGNVL